MEKNFGNILKDEGNDTMIDFANVLPTSADAAGIHILPLLVDVRSFLLQVVGGPTYASQYIYLCC